MVCDLELLSFQWFFIFFFNHCFILHCIYYSYESQGKANFPATSPCSVTQTFWPLLPQSTLDGSICYTIRLQCGLNLALTHKGEGKSHFIVLSLKSEQFRYIQSTETMTFQRQPGTKHQMIFKLIFSQTVLCFSSSVLLTYNRKRFHGHSEPQQTADCNSCDALKIKSLKWGWMIKKVGPLYISIMDKKTLGISPEMFP